MIGFELILFAATAFELEAISPALDRPRLATDSCHQFVEISSCVYGRRFAVF